MTGTACEPFTLMTYSHDGYGLGHLRRTSNIAARFVQDAPGSTALMLTGCPIGNVSLLPNGVDFIKLPSLIKVDTGVYAPAGLRIGRHKAKAIRASTILSAATEFKPRLFLVDHLPVGIYRELLATLRMLRGLQDPPVIVLGLRDIIDEPRVVCDLWHKEMTYEVICEYYDEVFIYGCKDIFDAARHYEMTAQLPGKVRYCGYVCSEQPIKSREQLREDLRLQKEKLIVVTTGGGHDGYPLLHSCMEAVQLAGRTAPFEAVFITGPLMDPAQREQLRAQGRELGVRVITWVEDPPSFINAADLVVTMGGYNSLCEVISLRKKALVVPRLGPRAEQRMRARRFEDKGLIDMLDPSEVSAGRLAERILADLERTDFPSAAVTIDTAGSTNVAARLMDLAVRRPGLRRVALASAVGSHSESRPSTTTSMGARQTWSSPGK
ncbi:MAG TPA: glycosyltransferase [Terriglobia bacterium]|nr:glycosyltransferase [Terriglobia bacterium]